MGRVGAEGALRGGAPGDGVKKVCIGWWWLTGRCAVRVKKHEKKLSENLEKSWKR